MRLKPTLEPGETIGKYEVERFIAAGGYGEVYAVLDEHGKRYALKLFVLRFQSDKRGAKRLAAEAEALRKIKHTNVVRYHDAHFSPETSVMYVVMEYLEGVTMRQLIRVEGAQRVERALDLTRQMCSGLAKAHEKGIIHRDIKPENIMVAKGDIIKVLDFGVAKLMGLHMNTTAGIGTPAYMAPEATRHPDKPDPRWDVFSVGLVLFELLTGQHAYADAEGKLPGNPIVIVTWHAERRPIKRVEEVTPDVLKPVADLVARAVTIDMNDRFASMLELEQAIERLLEQLSPGLGKGTEDWMRSNDEEEPELAPTEHALPALAPRTAAGTDIIATPEEALEAARARATPRDKAPPDMPEPEKLTEADWPPLHASLEARFLQELRLRALVPGTDGALELIAKTLLDHNDPWIRATAAYQASLLGDPRLLQPVLRAYAREKIPLPRKLLGAAAGMSGNKLPVTGKPRSPSLQAPPPVPAGTPRTPGPSALSVDEPIAAPTLRELLTFDWHDAAALVVGILGGGGAVLLLDFYRNGWGG